MQPGRAIFIQVAARLPAWVASVSLVLTIGCTKNPDVDYDADSNLNQVSARYYNCYDGGQSAEQFFADAPQNFFQNFDPNTLARVKGQLHHLPDPYIEHLYNANQQTGFQILEEPLGDGVEGLTQFSDWMPIWAKIAPGAVNTALNHEIGHALQQFVYKQGQPNGDSGDVRAAFNQAYLQESNNNGVGWYAKTQLAEYFAEVFQSYYCSPESQDFIASNLPQTYQLAQQYFLAPRWENGTGRGPGPGEGLPQDPADPGHSPGGQPSNIFVKVVDDRDAGAQMSWVYLSVPAEADRIVFCRNDDPQCSPQAQSDVDFQLAGQIGDRNIFKSPRAYTLAADTQLRVYAISTTAGRLVDQRTTLEFAVNEAGGLSLVE